MKKVKFLKFTMAFFACVLAVTMGSCDKNNDPKVPDLKCTPSKVEVAPGKTATVTVSGGTAPFTVTSRIARLQQLKQTRTLLQLPVSKMVQRPYSSQTQRNLQERFL